MYKTAAKRLGLPVEEVRSAMYYAEKLLNHANRPDGRFIIRMERRMAKRMQRHLRKQMNYMISATKGMEFFDETKKVRVQGKRFDDELNQIISAMPEKKGIVKTLQAFAGFAMLKSAQRQIRLLKLSKFGISFNLRSDAAISYMEQLNSLHLSNFRGSITRTTENGVRSLVIDSIQQGQSYTELAKRIREQGKAGLFAGSRAQTIAVDQLSNAYGHGGRSVVDEFKTRTGAKVSKLWVTAGDAKVTPGCKANGAQSWLLFEEAFQSGHQREPRHINCRCSVSHRIDSVP